MIVGQAVEAKTCTLLAFRASIVAGMLSVFAALWNVRLIDRVMDRYPELLSAATVRWLRPVIHLLSTYALPLAVFLLALGILHLKLVAEHRAATLTGALWVVALVSCLSSFLFMHVLYAHISTFKYVQ